MNKEEILLTHKIAKKKIKGKDNKERYIYSLQFTYPKNKKKQISGTTTEEIINKLDDYLNSLNFTFKDLYEIYIQDNEVFQGKASSYIRYTNHSFFFKNIEKYP